MNFAYPSHFQILEKGDEQLSKERLKRTYFVGHVKFYYFFLDYPQSRLCQVVAVLNLLKGRLLLSSFILL